MATVCDQHLYQSKRKLKNGIYTWLVFICFVIYILPAAQLMLKIQADAGRDGNGDVCYYNFLCRVQWGWIADYGHVFSNISYIFCGLAFVIHVTLR